MKRQRGFTLIELMVALVISSLLVIMLLTIFARVSFAYREQQQVMNVSTTLSAVRNALERDAKQAGLLLSQGFTVSSDHVLGNIVRRSPVRVVNRSNGPDEVAFYYANPDKQALVVASGPATTVTVDDASDFAPNDLVVLSTSDTTSFVNPIDSNDAPIARFAACVVQVAAVTGTTITFAESGPWGNSSNGHCDNAVGGKTMVYGFVGHYWRIDTTRPALAPLQLDPTGNLTGTSAFEDQAYNIADLQLSTYFYDADGLDTGDADTDGDRDWRSGNEQDTFTQAIPKANDFVAPLMISISIVARTPSNVEGVFTAQTPNLTVASNPDNNNIGDRASVALPSGTDPLLAGYRIYRHITFQADLRNMGVGR
ncbi:MAG: prepilin-type N-terminal cleavage/methylation domain-containing protein [Kofleriaceae bacterium]|nr:prepilin-type N-terminal cleavage/methylation domain-containing protein [Kofleriaceae bacterium]